MKQINPLIDLPRDKEESPQRLDEEIPKNYWQNYQFIYPWREFMEMEERRLNHVRT